MIALKRKKLAPIEQPPALKHDAMMLRRFKQDLSARGHLERRIVWNLIRHLEGAGFRVFRTFDGDEWRYPKTAKGAMELIFNLDEVSLRFIHACCGALRKDHKEAREHGVLLILGEGVDCINDWNYTEGDSDGFNAAMDAFDVEQFG